MHEEPALEGGRPQGQLERSLVRATLGLHHAIEDRRRVLEPSKSGEYDQQVQVAFSSQATSTWGYIDQPVGWEHPFVWSPLQRNPQFETPHVQDHIEFTSQLSDLVIAKAHMTGWNTNDQGWLIGGMVRIAVCAPNASSPINCEGIVHLTFQAYAYPTDEDLET